MIRLDDGSLVTLTAAAHSPGAVLQERIEIDGERGRLDLPDPYGNGPLRWYPGPGGGGWAVAGTTGWSRPRRIPRGVLRRGPRRYRSPRRCR